MSGIPTKANLAEVSDLSVDTGDIKTGACTTAKLGALAVTTGKIGAAACRKAKIGTGIQRLTIVQSAARATNAAITVTGIATGGDVLNDVYLVSTAGVPTQITSKASITSANTILISTKTTGKHIHVMWQDRT